MTVKEKYVITINTTEDFFLFKDESVIVSIKEERIEPERIEEDCKDFPQLYRQPNDLRKDQGNIPERS